MMQIECFDSTDSPVFQITKTSDFSPRFCLGKIKKNDDNDLPVQTQLWEQLVKTFASQSYLVHVFVNSNDWLLARTTARLVDELFTRIPSFQNLLPVNGHVCLKKRGLGL